MNAMLLEVIPVLYHLNFLQLVIKTSPLLQDVTTQMQNKYKYKYRMLYMWACEGGPKLVLRSIF